MTIADNYEPIKQETNGVATQFSFDFYALSDAFIKVYLETDGVQTLVNSTDYEITFTENGGVVAFYDPPAAGSYIIITRDTPREQETPFYTSSGFPAKTVEGRLDKLTAMVQELQDNVDRSAKVPVGTNISPELPVPDEGKALVWDGTALANSDETLQAISDKATGAYTYAQEAKGYRDQASASATQAEEWAIKTDAPVEDSEYSAKYHAQASASSAAESAASATAAQEAALSITNGWDLFDHKWSDHLLNDQNWLRADTFSWQDGTVYSEAYNHLVDDVDGKTATSETVGSYTISYYLADDGHKITTDETNVANIYNESGVAWYYILDTANQRFKLPRTKYGFVGLRDTVGKYVPESLPNIKGRGYDQLTDSDKSTISTTGAFGTSSNYSGYKLTYASLITSSDRGSLDFDASRSSSTYQDNAPVQQRATQMYLYFYVGQFTQTATEQTAGLNSELFNGKADVDMSNVPSNIGSTAKSYFAGIGMPSDNWENVSLPASGGYVIAPANGYYCISGTGQTLYLGIEDSNGASTLETWTSNSGTFLPIYKGQKCIVGYSATPSTFRFVYAQGEV